jgi:hypothetical protein
MILADKSFAAFSSGSVLANAGVETIKNIKQKTSNIFFMAIIFLPLF